MRWVECIRREWWWDLRPASPDEQVRKWQRASWGVWWLGGVWWLIQDEKILAKIYRRAPGPYLIVSGNGAGEEYASLQAAKKRAEVQP